MGEREHVFFNGRKYSKQKNGYYQSTTTPRKTLHVAVWEANNGAVPKGFHVHHKDENKDNNDISNLELLTSSEHSFLHHVGKVYLNRRKPARKNQSICIQCGKRFASVKKGCKYCSEKCKQTWLTEHGRFNNRIVRTCERCGKGFETSKYDVTRFCSHKCAKAATDENNAKLKPEDVRYIRLNPDNLTNSQLAEKLAVTPTTICSIIHRRLYPNVE